MTPAQRQRWRLHREHCAASAHGEPCYGPSSCRVCLERVTAERAAPALAPRPQSVEPLASLGITYPREVLP